MHSSISKIPSSDNEEHAEFEFFLSSLETFSPSANSTVIDLLFSSSVAEKFIEGSNVLNIC